MYFSELETHSFIAHFECIGIIHLVRLQNFPNQGVRNVSFSENFANVLNE